MKKYLSTSALVGVLVASMVIALINCTDLNAPATFTVKFDTNGGIPAVQDKTIENGKLLANPATEPTKEGYTFAGWHKDKALTQMFDFTTEKITANITLHAKWIKAHTVAFDANGGTNVDPQSVESGKKASKPTDPTKQGHTFEGWYSDKTLATPFDFNTATISANITLYAKWIKAHTVAFDANGGTNVDPQSVESGKKASKPTDPTKQGHTFEGWYSDKTLATPFDFNTATISANITLYAKWAPITYTVTFNPNNEENLPPVSVAYGGVVARPKTITKPYHTFLGWYKDETFTQAFDFDTETIFGSITLYAKWESRLVTIPEVKFRAKLQALIPGAFVGGQFYPESADVTGRKSLDVSSADIEDLTGIKYFTALTELNCKDNRLTALDVSTLIALQSLVCSENALTRLDVSNNIKLVQLWCHKNRLTYLDIRGVRSTVQPLSLYEGADETNAIDTLKVHENLKQDDEVKELKTARGAGITMAAYSAPSGSTSYTSVCGNYDPNTDSCLLVEIPDAVFRAKLQFLIPDAFEGELLNTGSVEVTGRTTLGLSNSSADSIRSLAGIEYFTGLERLDCNGNSLTTLDVSKNIRLTKLGVKSNNLDSLDVSKNTGLTKLGVTNNNLNSLDVSTNTLLTELLCNGNSLTALDVSKNTGLTRLGVTNNNLNSLDVSTNTQLTELYTSNNNLNSLDVSTNTLLTELVCDGNSLTALDVSNNPSILTLECHNNQLTELDVSNQGDRLTTLNCKNNRLTRLNVSNNPGIFSLKCNNNRLTRLDIRGARGLVGLGVDLTIQADAKETNVINTLKVHENLKNHAQISAVKTVRGDKVTISTYSAAAGSTTYTAVCSDYDPTEADEQDRCKEVP